MSVIKEVFEEQPVYQEGFKRGYRAGVEAMRDAVLVEYGEWPYTKARYYDMAARLLEEKR